jgi:hypothetical protein
MSDYLEYFDDEKLKEEANEARVQLVNGTWNEPKLKWYLERACPTARTTSTTSPPPKPTASSCTSSLPMARPYPRPSASWLPAPPSRTSNNQTFLRVLRSGRGYEIFQPRWSFKKVSQILLSDSRAATYHISLTQYIAILQYGRLTNGN